jgi:hypothetical protein
MNKESYNFMDVPHLQIDKINDINHKDQTDELN